MSMRNKARLQPHLATVANGIALTPSALTRPVWGMERGQPIVCMVSAPTTVDDQTSDQQAFLESTPH